jgi:aminopeptidase N
MPSRRTGRNPLAFLAPLLLGLACAFAGAGAAEGAFPRASSGPGTGGRQLAFSGRPDDGGRRVPGTSMTRRIHRDRSRPGPHGPAAARSGMSTGSAAWSGRRDVPAACSGSYDVEEYDARLEVFPDSGSLAGVASIHLRSCTDALAVVELEARELTIREVLADGEAVPFTHEDGTLKVRLARPARSGEALTLRVRYDGRPTRGMHFGPDFVYTAFHTAHWLVSNGDPADRARLALQVIVPAGLEAVSGSRRVAREVLPDGRVRFSWREDRPYSSYLFGFAAAPFVEGGTQEGAVRLRYLGVGVTPAQLDSIFAATLPALRFFEEVAGVPYPGPAYTQALLPGAPPQELAGMAIMDTAYGTSVLRDPREDYLVVHELAHAWWGNLLSAAGWSEFWLNEGMTTFMVAAYKERHWGRDEYEREILLARLRYERTLAQGVSRPIVFRGWRTPAEAGGPVAYSGGALVLHLLRQEVGERAFWEGVRAYTRAGADSGTVRTVDLRRAMEAASGRDLRAFFDHWIYGPPPPALVARHRIEGNAVVITLEQPSPGPVSVVVAVETDRGRERRRVTLTRAREEVRIPAAGTVLSVRVDEGGFLPRSPDHARPVPMLLHQISHEPDPAGRVDALLALARACPADAAIAGCAGIRAAVEGAAAGDPSRVVRQFGTRTAPQVTP